MQQQSPILVMSTAGQGTARAQALAAQGYAARAVDAARFHLPAILDARPRAILLDRSQGGLEHCRALRAHYTGGILMQLPERAPSQELEALEAGADDVVDPETSSPLLVAKLRRILWRTEPTREGASRLTLERAQRRIRYEGHLLDLTEHEFDILATLVERPGEIVTRQELYLTVRGTEYDGLERGLDVHVSRIRAKLKGIGVGGRSIKAIRGAGYTWVA